AIFGVGRNAVPGLDHISPDDTYSKFHDGDNLPDSIQGLLEEVHEAMSRLPDGKNTVVAIDVMRGKGADGETRDYLCEINRRPLRISRYHLTHLNASVSDPQ